MTEEESACCAVIEEVTDDVPAVEKDVHSDKGQQLSSCLISEADQTDSNRCIGNFMLLFQQT